MVREDIIEGLRAAMARGQTLRQAMMSFYNAGYVKDEIEEAARVMQTRINNPQLQQQFPHVEEAQVFQRGQAVVRHPNEKPREVLSQTAKLPQPKQLKTPQTVQKVSAYGTQSPPKMQQNQSSPQFQSQSPSQQPPSQQHPSQTPSQQPPSPAQALSQASLPEQPLSSPPSPVQKPPQTSQNPPQIQQSPQLIQKVSSYGQENTSNKTKIREKPRGKIMIFVLLGILILLIGSLVAVLFFKEKILSFFEGF